MKPIVIATFHIDEFAYDSIYHNSVVDCFCNQEPHRSKIEYIRSLNLPVEISVARQPDKQTYQVRIYANMDDEATLWYRIRYGE